MKLFKSKLIGAVLTAGLLAFAQSERAFSQDSHPENAEAAQPEKVEAPQPEKEQALLQKVKQSELDRRVAIKQTEIDRLKQDLEKSKKEMDEQEKNLDSTTALIAESNGNEDQLEAERKRLEQTLDLTMLRIEAERKRGDGLKSLSAAQSREIEAINQRMAEMDVRSQVRESELQLLSQGKPVPGEDNDEVGSAELHKLKKALASNEAKTVTAEAIAREAIKAAAARLELADEAAARVKRMSDDMAKDNPEPVAEQSGGKKPASTQPSGSSPTTDKKMSKPTTIRRATLVSPTPGATSKNASPKQ